jgi:CheY-like chemotaxis protein
MTRILVIDDDPQMRRVVSRILTEAGYSVIEAGDGREGLQQLSGFDPAVIVTDILMPEMEGVEFVRHARERLPAVKIIAMSGGGRGSDKSLILRMIKSFGADAALSKPFGAEALLDAVRCLLPAS